MCNNGKLSSNMDQGRRLDGFHRFYETLNYSKVPNKRAGPNKLTGQKILKN